MATSDRLPPTLEDQEIFRRNIKRVLRNIDLRYPSNSPEKAKATVRVIRAACGDYLHFSASERDALRNDPVASTNPVRSAPPSNS